MRELAKRHADEFEGLYADQLKARKYVPPVKKQSAALEVPSAKAKAPRKTARKRTSATK